MTSDLVWQLGRLAIAALLGAVVGLERRYQAQPAGMRTQMIIAASCCFAMELSEGPLDADTGRIVQAVLTGIGFLGGGGILKSGLSIHGLTTAATIWASATIGMAVGAGLLIHAVVLTALVTGGLIALVPLELLLTRRRELRKIRVEARDEAGLLERVRRLLEHHAIRVEDVGLAQSFERKVSTYTLVAACPEGLAVDLVARELGQIPGVSEVRFE